MYHTVGTIDFGTFVLIEIKEWMFLTFFPQEDVNKLNRLRTNLTPFLKAVVKALSIEMEVDMILDEVKNAITDEIIRNIPAENSTSTTGFFSVHTVDTLHLEFDGLLDLRL